VEPNITSTFKKGPKGLALRSQTFETVWEKQIALFGSYFGIMFGSTFFKGGKGGF
jgi:hypothetical protein